MDFATAVGTCFAKYATFAGRAARAEFWWFVVFSLAGTGLCALIDELLFPGENLPLIGTVFAIAMFLPSFAVGARRLHDVDRSGWLQVNGLLPVIGWIILLLWLIRPGTVGPNRYGEGRAPATPDDSGNDVSNDVEQRIMARFARSSHWRSGGPTE